MDLREEIVEFAKIDARGKTFRSVNAEPGLPDEAGGRDTEDDTEYPTRDAASTGKLESAAGERR